MNANVYFAGAGGSSLGLHDAGYDVIGWENWQPAVDTHRANGMTCHMADLSDPATDLRMTCAPVAWFSPPCQPFSAAGDGGGEFDDRDGFPWTLRIIAGTLPDVVFIENVKGLTFSTHADYFAAVLDGIRRTGYELEWRVLNTADYGVPQTRERCIIIARRDGGPITWPAPTHTEGDSLFLEPWVSMAEALGWTGVVKAGRDANATTRSTDRPAPTVLARKDPNAWVLDRGASADAGVLLTPVSSPAPTVIGTSGCQTPWKWVGGGDAIRVTLDELATLQGFPPDYQWRGNKTAIAKQIGNAVPPVLAQRLAEANRPVALEAAA